jgi:hypothetical protein
VTDDHDFSGMLRPLIRSRNDSYESPEHALVEAVRDLAIPAMRRDPGEATSVLVSSGVLLLRKVAFFVVAEAIRQCLDEVVDARFLAGVATRLLGSESSGDAYLRVEYAELAQAVSRVDPAALEVINQFIATAYERDLNWIRQSLVDQGSSEADAEAQAKERADRYKHHWLSAIGSDALPPKLRIELSEFDSEYGEIEGALNPVGLATSWSGPNPHSTQNEMAAMSPHELIEQLASWHDLGSGWGPEPSHEGQGRELAALLTTHPLAVSGVTDLIRRLRPTYLRAILQGWSAALKVDLELDWTQVSDLIRDVLDHGNSSSFPVEGAGLDDDRDFRSAKSAAVGLLEELVKRRTAVSIPDTFMARFADLLINQADDMDAWAEYSAYQPSDSSSDPLTMSLNWQWPNRLRGLIHLATRDKDAPWTQAVLAAIEVELARPDKHGAGRAVLGENLGRLLTDAPEWLRVHVEEYFGVEEGINVPQQIAFTTAIATHYYHRDLYDVLSGSMIAAVGVGESLVAGWRSDSSALQRIGEWAITALIHGHKTMDDPVVRAFFSSSSPEVRGGAISSIAWSFFRAEKVDDDIRDRFAQLWDERVVHVRDHPNESDELKGFFWFAKGKKFADDWWLPRLEEALTLEPSIATERSMIGKELAQASTSNPRTALAVLKLLLDGPDEGGRVTFDLAKNAVPFVIAEAISSGDEDLKQEAEAYMNVLGAKGNITLDAEIRNVLTGDINQQDISE